MSADALAVVQRFFDLAAGGDLEEVSEVLDPEVVWLGTRGGLDEHRVIRGRDACVAYMREVEEPWERLDVAVERLIEADGTIVAFLRETADARGADLRAPTAPPPAGVQAQNLRAEEGWSGEL